MNLSELILGFVAVMGLVAVLLGSAWWRRRRRLSRLVAAAAEVEAAVSGGRLPQSTGEALLQHLEGLRRACPGGGME